jgi:sensor histidine kinase YesM
MVANTKNRRLSAFRLKPLHVINPFTVRNALWLSLPAGIILTGIMTLGHLDTATWTIASSYHQALSLALNCGLFFVLFLFVFSIVKSKLPVAWRFVLATAGSLLIAAVFSLLSIGLQRLIYEEFMIEQAYGGNVIKDGLIVITTIMITLLIFNLNHHHQMILENERLQSENLLVRYETLESQLDPHFLFNSLNTLSGLIGTDDDKAQQYLQQLASTYRYTIQQNKLVPIEEELRFADAYLYMMNIRYDNNLRVVRQLEGVEGYVVPISVQQLIENALKHNVVSDKHPLEIRLEATGNSTLRVSNLVCPKEATESEGVGLSNLDKRYELIAGEHISMHSDNEMFLVEIPLIPRQKAMEILNKMKE